MRKRHSVGVLLSLGLLAVIGASSVARAHSPLRSTQLLCSSGYVSAVIGGQPKCLRAGEFCSPPEETEYEHYGFTCVNGHLKQGAPTTTTSATTTAPPPNTTSSTTTSEGTTPVSLGKLILLAHRTKTTGCKLGANPDRRCSPGAYYSGLTKPVICSSGFRTSTIRNVPQSEKYQVEREYGLAAKGYGSTMEIDHIISLELGGANDIANLYPEKANAHPGYHVKDKLENKLHNVVCSGQMTLRAAQTGIARYWQALYKRVFGVAPVG